MKFEIPPYSQFLDVENPEWKDKSCGIVSLQMLLDYWKKGNCKPGETDKLIDEGLTIGAYIPSVGWKHQELIELAKTRGLVGEAFDWFEEHPEIAFNKLIPYLGKHPVMVSIYKNLKEGVTGHLVVVTGYENGKIFYNDPSSKERRKIKQEVELQKFLSGWKRRIVVIHPKACTCNL